MCVERKAKFRPDPSPCGYDSSPLLPPRASICQVLERLSVAAGEVLLAQGAPAECVFGVIIP
jgi:hypothetical protein